MRPSAKRLFDSGPRRPAPFGMTRVTRIAGDENARPVPPKASMTLEKQDAISVAESAPFAPTLGPHNVSEAKRETRETRRDETAVSREAAMAATAASVGGAARGRVKAKGVGGAFIIGGDEARPMESFRERQATVSNEERANLFWTDRGQAQALRRRLRATTDLAVARRANKPRGPPSLLPPALPSPGKADEATQADEASLRFEGRRARNSPNRMHASVPADQAMFAYSNSRSAMLQAKRLNANASSMAQILAPASS